MHLIQLINRSRLQGSAKDIWSEVHLLKRSPHFARNRTARQASYGAGAAGDSGTGAGSGGMAPSGAAAAGTGATGTAAAGSVGANGGNGAGSASMEGSAGATASAGGDQELETAMKTVMFGMAAGSSMDAGGSATAGKEETAAGTTTLRLLKLLCLKYHQKK